MPRASLLALILIFASGLPLQKTFAEDQWFCKEGASRSLGDVLESCGIAKSPDEATARKNALEAAFEEFDRICRESANCRDYEKTVQPMRTECIQGKDTQYTCYRALDFTVTSQKKQKSFDDKDKKDAVVNAITNNTDANPDSSNLTNAELAQTTTPTPYPSGDRPVVYRNVYYGVYNPYVYVIGSAPQVVYVRSQLPPQYVPPPPPATNPQPVAHKANSQRHPNHPKKNGKKKWRERHPHH